MQKADIIRLLRKGATKMNFFDACAPTPVVKVDDDDDARSSIPAPPELDLILPRTEIWLRKKFTDLPPFKLQRDHARRVNSGQAEHLAKLCRDHGVVMVFRYPDGTMERADGNTRAERFLRGLVDFLPRRLLVLIWDVESLAEAKELYDRLDSTDASKNLKDAAASFERGVSIVWEKSRWLVDRRYVNPTIQAYAILQDSVAMGTAEELGGLPGFRPELVHKLVSDELTIMSVGVTMGPVLKMVEQTGMRGNLRNYEAVGMLISLALFGRVAIPFWKAVSDYASVKRGAKERDAVSWWEHNVETAYHEKKTSKTWVHPSTTLSQIVRYSLAAVDHYLASPDVLIIKKMPGMIADTALGLKLEAGWPKRARRTS